MQNFKIIPAEADHYSEIANMLKRFSEEIEQQIGQKVDLGGNYVEMLCRESSKTAGCTLFVGLLDKEVVAFIHIVESFALYTGGKFGIIQEFYVKENYRSQGYGKKLLDHSKYFALKNRWKRLELATPPLPEFNSSLKFYQREGLEITGGAKMKFQL